MPAGRGSPCCRTAGAHESRPGHRYRYRHRRWMGARVRAEESALRACRGHGHRWRHAATRQARVQAPSPARTHGCSRCRRTTDAGGPAESRRLSIHVGRGLPGLQACRDAGRRVSRRPDSPESKPDHAHRRRTAPEHRRPRTPAPRRRASRQARRPHERIGRSECVELVAGGRMERQAGDSRGAGGLRGEVASDDCPARFDDATCGWRIRSERRCAKQGHLLSWRSKRFCGSGPMAPTAA